MTPLNDDDETPTKTLGFYLDCNENNKSTTWSCFANAEYRLVSHKEGQPGLSKSITILLFLKFLYNLQTITNNN